MYGRGEKSIEIYELSMVGSWMCCPIPMAAFFPLKDDAPMMGGVSPFDVSTEDPPPHPPGVCAESAPPPMKPGVSRD